ncbi:pro-FMRFamide-related neuropeptide VF [Brachyhypopomus gauderio]|uniref:pro-FMRFamide-related neuropeptide VF n=1 Tax=Brachyhypopomus gauderio TaxID=698409 RepID=UPI004042740F
MPYPALTLTLGILGSLMLHVSAVTLPLAVNDPDITSRVYPENNQDTPRSLEMEDFTFSVVPTSGRVNSPTILRLHPISAKPSHLHANLPLRFGREAYVERTPKSSINLPQRFGRSQVAESFEQVCTECRRAQVPPSATLPQRFGRRNAYVVDPLRALALFTRTLESSIPRTRDYDYMLEDKALKSKEYIDFE